MSADTIEGLYVEGFKANLNLAPQQTNTRMVSCVDADLNYGPPGKMFNAEDILGDDSEQDVIGRAPDSPSSFADAVRRVGFFTAKNFGRFIDNLDKARLLADPTNPVMQGMMAAKNRATDDVIIAAALGSAREGETGGTTVAYKSAQSIAADNREFLHAAESSVVAGSGDLPLTVGKVIKAKNLLDKSELEGERYFAAGSDQLSNLLSSVAMSSADYNAVKALVNGEVNSWMGFTWVRTERLAVAAGIRSCIAWVKPAIVYAQRPIVEATITKRADKSFRWYAYYEVERGAVRRYDTGVVKVLCKEG